MKIFFLKANIPLTKTFTKTPAGIEKSSYPNVYEVTSMEEDVPNLKALASTLLKHAALGHCMVKGELSRALVSESRAGTTDPNAVTSFACLDLDGLPVKTPADFMKAVDMEDVSHVVQYSPSYLIGSKLLRCHIFVQLTTPMSAPALKQHLIALNFKIDMLKNSLELTKTGNALRYGLDITTCQNDKLIYIADPICVGFKAPVKKRIEYIKKAHETFNFNDPVSVVVNRAAIEEHIALLREKANLPKRKNEYKFVNSIEVLKKPDQSIITALKEERGFVYFNLNGGDSWAYYHSANNPDFIHNFKGEPVYLTKELLPDYWAQVSSKKAAPPPTATISGTTFLAFLDKKGGQYLRGTYDAQADVLDLYVAKNETQVRHFALQNGFALPDFIPEWEMEFDPHAAFRVDEKAQKINTFQPTIYMQPHNPFKGKGRKLGLTNHPIIDRVLHHALGSDQAVTNHFINWLAYIAQRRERTRTAWVMHGCSGTGKGILANNILTPLFGASHVASKRMEEMDTPYNGYMESKFFVIVDEVQTSTMKNEKGVMAKLKNFITEPSISVRELYQSARPVKNYTNWIFASNMPDPVSVDMNDRRFNVGKYQPDKLVITQAEIDNIPTELQSFYDFLMAWPVDEVAASSPLHTEDRQNLMHISEASIDSVATALLEGNFEFFIDQLPTNTVSNNVTLDLVENYKGALLRVLNRIENGACNVSRDELHAIFDWTVGDMPKSPNKFTSRLKHHRIHTTKVRVDGVAVYGLPVNWRVIPIDAKARLTGKPQPVNGAKKSK